MLKRDHRARAHPFPEAVLEVVPRSKPPNSSPWLPVGKAGLGQQRKSAGGRHGRKEGRVPTPLVRGRTWPGAERGGLLRLGRLSAVWLQCPAALGLGTDT